MELSPEEIRVRDLVGKEGKKEEGGKIRGSAVEHEKKWMKPKDDDSVWRRGGLIRRLRVDTPDPAQRSKHLWQNKPAVASEIPAHSMSSEETLQFSCATCGSKNRQGQLKCRHCGALTSPKIVKTFHVQQKPDGLSQSVNALPSNRDPTSEWKHVRRIMPRVSKDAGPLEEEKRTQEVNREPREREERKQRELLNKILQENRRGYVPLSGDQFRAGTSEKPSDKRKSLDGTVTRRDSFVGGRSIGIPQSSQSSTTPAQTPQSSTIITQPSQLSPMSIRPPQISTIVAKSPQSSTETTPVSSSWAVWTSPPQDPGEIQAKKAKDVLAQPHEPEKTEPVTSYKIRRIPQEQPQKVEKVESVKHKYPQIPNGQNLTEGRENDQISQKSIEQSHVVDGDTSSIPLVGSTVAPLSQSSAKMKVPSSSWAAWRPPADDFEEQQSAESGNRRVPSTAESRDLSDKRKSDQNSRPVRGKLYKAFSPAFPQDPQSAGPGDRLVPSAAESRELSDKRKSGQASRPLIRRMHNTFDTVFPPDPHLAEPGDQTIPSAAENRELRDKSKSGQNLSPVIRKHYTNSDAVFPSDPHSVKLKVSPPILRKIAADALDLRRPPTAHLNAWLYSHDDIEDTRNTRNYMRVREREDRDVHDRFKDHEGEEEDDDDNDPTESRAERKQRRKQEKLARKTAGPPMPIILPDFISIGNLATALRVRTEEFIQKMVSLGFEETNGDYVLDAETAGLIATEFNFEPIIERGQDEDLIPQPPAEDNSLLPPRPPVVTIMGHVDHGKTTLLDYLRKSSVAASEHGGITQHIGAFKVSMPAGRIITFLDTPGHAAFLNMRQRGANVTDIVILVVAADDSVKPQTIEAIKHAQAAKVPMIVAINKVDKGDSTIEQVKQDLARHGVDIEDFGGETQVVCVSGKTGLGMNELEDATIALADILDMRAETDGQAEGWVLEATTKQKGRVATVLVRRGTIYPGNVIVAGTTWAKVRTMRNEAGATIRAAGPGTPVEIDGWREQPEAGDEVLQANDEQHAKSVVEIRLERARNTQLALDMIAINEARRIEQEKRLQEKRDSEAELAKSAGRQAASKSPSERSSGVKDVHFVVKADVSGSVEAVVNSISALGNEEVRANVLRAAVGSVSEFDVEHAAAAKGHIICFNISADQGIVRKAEAAGVQIIDHKIIYKLIDDVTERLTQQLAPTVTIRVVGEAEVAQVFQINIKGRQSTSVAGCKVRNGVVNRTAKTRVLRDREVIYDGMLLALVLSSLSLHRLTRF